MTLYSSLTLPDLLDAFSSSEPVPGGGSAAALAGALGVSLLLMAAGIQRTRTGAAEETADLAEVSARLRPLRDRLAELVDLDSEAYGMVLTALRLPNDSEVEKSVRRRAIDAAMRDATETPLDTMRACQQALRAGITVARNSSPNAASDVGVAIELLVAAMRGAGLNVDTNLKVLKDTGYVAQVQAERQEIDQESLSDAARARLVL